MLVHSPTTNIFAVLLFLLAGTLDLYLFAATLRLALGRIPAAKSSGVLRMLREFADPVPQYVQRRFAAWRGSPTPLWLAWSVVLACVLVTRQALVSLVLAMQ